MATLKNCVQNQSRPLPDGGINSEGAANKAVPFFVVATRRKSSMSGNEFWVYENWTAEHKAVIHSGTCGHCNHGKGCQPSKADGLALTRRRSASDASHAGAPRVLCQPTSDR